jgi:hypothetical protein
VTNSHGHTVARGDGQMMVASVARMMASINESVVGGQITSAPTINYGQCQRPLVDNWFEGHILP